MTITAQAGLELLTEKGTITWENARSRSTLDLTFATETLAGTVESCKPSPELAQSSDHIPITTTLSLHFNPVPKVQHRQWKKVDIEKLRKEVKARLPFRTLLETKNQIDIAAESLTKAIQQGIEVAVPWSKTSECSESF